MHRPAVSVTHRHISRYKCVHYKIGYYYKSTNLLFNCVFVIVQFLVKWVILEMNERTNEQTNKHK